VAVAAKRLKTNKTWLSLCCASAALIHSAHHVLGRSNKFNCGILDFRTPRGVSITIADRIILEFIRHWKSWWGKNIPINQSQMHQVFFIIRLNEILTVINPETKVAFPPSLIDKIYKRIYISSTCAAANDRLALNHRQLLERKKTVIKRERFQQYAILSIPSNLWMGELRFREADEISAKTILSPEFSSAYCGRRPDCNSHYSDVLDVVEWEALQLLEVALCVASAANPHFRAPKTQDSIVILLPHLQAWFYNLTHNLSYPVWVTDSALTWDDKEFIVWLKLGYGPVCCIGIWGW